MPHRKRTLSLLGIFLLPTLHLPAFNYLLAERRCKKKASEAIRKKIQRIYRNARNAVYVGVALRLFTIICLEIQTSMEV